MDISRVLYDTENICNRGFECFIKSFRNRSKLFLMFRDDLKSRSPADKLLSYRWMVRAGINNCFKLEDIISRMLWLYLKKIFDLPPTVHRHACRNPWADNPLDSRKLLFQENEFLIHAE